MQGEPSPFARGLSPVCLGLPVQLQFFSSEGIYFLILQVYFGLRAFIHDVRLGIGVAVEFLRNR